MSRKAEPEQAMQLQPRPSGQLQPIALRAMFWRPDFLVASDWLEHLPAAFWLVEAAAPRVLVEIGTADGAAYFAFCQAVDRLGLDTRCFAVPAADAGDGTEPPAAGRIPEALRDHNDARYASFSRLLSGDEDEVLAHFADGAI